MPKSGRPPRRSRSEVPTFVTVDDIKAAILRLLERSPGRKEQLAAATNDRVYVTYAYRDKRGRWRRGRRRTGMTVREVTQQLALWDPSCGGQPVSRLPFNVADELRSVGKYWTHQNPEGLLRHKEALAQLFKEKIVECVSQSDETEYYNPWEKRTVREDVIRLTGKRPQPQRRRGRPPDTDPIADAKLAAKWDSGHYRYRRELAGELGISERSLNLALNRHRGRQRRTAVK